MATKKKSTKKRAAKPASKAAPKKSVRGKATNAAAKPKPPKKTAAKKAGAKQKAPSKSAANAPVVDAGLQKRVTQAAQDLAVFKREELLGRDGKAPATLALTDFIVRQKVLEVAGEGRATGVQRAALESLFKETFADHWARLAKGP